MAKFRTQPGAWIRSLRSIILWRGVHKKAVLSPVALFCDEPTIWRLELMLEGKIVLSPGSVPRSIAPRCRCHMKPRGLLVSHRLGVKQLEAPITKPRLIPVAKLDGMGISLMPVALVQKKEVPEVSSPIVPPTVPSSLMALAS